MGKLMIRIKQKMISFLAAITLVAGLCFYSESQNRFAMTETDASAGTFLPVIAYHNIVAVKMEWKKFLSHLRNWKMTLFG